MSINRTIKKIPLFGWIGLGVIVVAQPLMLLKVEPIASNFYNFAWFGYILFVDGLVFALKGNSLIASRRKELIFMLVVSSGWWWLFEAYNYFFLNNWQYHNLPAIYVVMVIGKTVAFATVLPLLFETMELFEALGFFYRSGCRQWRISGTMLSGMMVIGVAFCVLPMIFPEYTFPLVWGGFYFLLDPIAYKIGAPSILGEFERGSLQRPLVLLAVGLFSGIMWEFWNYWAASYWTYHIPHWGQFKIFQMPILGFIGFPAFAWESYSFYYLLRHVFCRTNHQEDAISSPAVPPE